MAESSTKDELAYHAFNVLTFGNSVLTHNGSKWQDTRSVLNKAFRQKSLDCVRNVVTERTERMLKQWIDQKVEIDVGDDLLKLSYGTILEFTFGRSFSDEEVKGKAIENHFLLNLFQRSRIINLIEKRG